MRRLHVLDDLRADVSYGVRVLLRNPGFTALAVIALALGIGANVTVFTLANAFLFKNLPFDDSDRILYLSNTLSARPGTVRSVSYPDFLEFREQVKSFEGLAAFSNRSVDLSDGNGFPERYRCPLVTPGADSSRRAGMRDSRPARDPRRPRRSLAERVGRQGSLEAPSRASTRAIAA